MLKLLGSLAVTNLKKNRALYFPYGLTAVTMIVITYLLHALSKNPTMSDVYGGSGTGATLSLGVFVMQLVALLTILYANSVVMKNRSKELGLYSILGLDRAQIQLLSLMETVLFAVGTVVVGLLLGVVFNRLAFALLLKAMRYPIALGYSFDWQSVIWTAILFAVIFGVVIVVNAFRVQSSRPLELLKSKKQGETKGRFLAARAVIGFILLAVAYYLSQTVVSPIKSLYMFFFAVILVVVATYILFDAGSIAFLQLLKRRKNFYYQPTNFISVSNLIFRMRKNAAGLASICILSTMVLVTIGATASLQVGAEKLIREQYPTEFEFQTAITADMSLDQVRQEVRQLPDVAKGSANGFYDFSSFYTAGVVEGDVLNTLHSGQSILPEAMLQVIPVSDYNRLLGTSIKVPSGTVLVGDHSLVTNELHFSAIQLATQQFQIAEGVDVTALSKKVPVSANITDHNYYVIMNDDDMDAVTQHDESDRGVALVRGYAAFWNTTSTTEDDITSEGQLYNEYIRQHPTLAGGISSRTESARLLFSFYGSLLFLGILLSIAFLVGAVLVIYYKQVSEGYEDRDRYALLKKIGIDQDTIHHSINRQVLIVFFLPLLTAFLHTALSYKMVSKIVLIFGIDPMVVLYTMLIAGAIFMVMYLIIYRATSRSYYRIINR